MAEERKAEMANKINRLIKDYFNILLVTCGHCGAMQGVEAEGKEYTCTQCKVTSEPCDFPDLFY